MKTRRTSQRLAHDYTQTACGAAVSDLEEKSDTSKTRCQFIFDDMRHETEKVLHLFNIFFFLVTTV